MTARQDIRIVHLLDAPEAVPKLAGWFVEEWMPWYGPDGRGDAEGDLAACGSRDALPICLVALTLGGALLGTVALKSESVGSEAGVGPWLAAMLVGQDHRGKGVGKALVEAIAAEARRLGFGAIYTSAAPNEGMVRRGWQPIGAAESLRGPVTIYRLRIDEKKPLPSPPPN